MAMKHATKRFACTQCSKCCDRSPEVGLSEAALLSDVFVFRLMFRLYWLPQQLATFGANAPRSHQNAVLYERRRLLSVFAARKSSVKMLTDGKRKDFTKYLVISAFTLDTKPGACTSLRDNLCGIYERRPQICRSVPLRYSRPEAASVPDLEAFVETEGYRCDTSEAAPIILKDGLIVDTAIQSARSAAIAIAERDRRWSEAIVQRMKPASAFDQSLPSLKDVEANAQIGALTTSMRVAWEIAVKQGLLGFDEYKRLIADQLDLIDQRICDLECPQDVRQTLVEMRTEYQHHLGRVDKRLQP